MESNDLTVTKWPATDDEETYKVIVGETPAVIAGAGSETSLSVHLYNHGPHAIKLAGSAEATENSIAIIPAGKEWTGSTAGVLLFAAIEKAE